MRVIRDNEILHSFDYWQYVMTSVLMLVMCCIVGSDSAVVVSDKHTVNQNPMKPPFPAGTELAMFGQLAVIF